MGDVDLNGVFDSSDFVAAFVAGKYETDDQATWGEGDWNGDLVFLERRFVEAFSDGGYEVGEKQPPMAFVPEPAALGLFALGMLLVAMRRRGS